MKKTLTLLFFSWLIVSSCNTLKNTSTTTAPFQIDTTLLLETEGGTEVVLSFAAIAPEVEILEVHFQGYKTIPKHQPSLPLLYVAHFPKRLERIMHADAIQEGNNTILANSNSKKEEISLLYSYKNKEHSYTIKDVQRQQP